MTTAALALKSFAGSGFGAGVLLLLLTESSISDAAVHAVVLAVAAIVLAPLGGILADRFPPAWLYAATSTFEAATCMSYGLLLFNRDVVPLSGVIVLGLISGCLESFASSNQRVVLSAATKGAQRAVQLSKIRLFINIARAVAPAVAGLLVATVSPQIFFAIFALLLLLSGGLILSEHRVLVRGAAVARTESKMRGALTYLRFAPWLIVFSLVSAVQAAAWLSGFRLATADYYLATIGSAVTWGYVLAGFNIGMLVGSFVARYLRLRRDIFWAIIFPGLLSLPLLMFYFSTKPVWFVCFAFLAGLFFDFAIIYGQSALIDGIPDRVLGTTSSLTAVTEQAGIAAGYLVVLVTQGVVTSHNFILAAALTTAVATALAILTIVVLNYKRRHALQGDLWVAAVWPHAYDSVPVTGKAAQNVSD